MTARKLRPGKARSNDQQGTVIREPATFAIAPPIEPMLAKLTEGIPTGDGWLYEPKWDGFRAICFRAADDVYVSSRKELPFSRYFPDVVEALKTLDEQRLVLDGELVIFTADGRSILFDTLQMRLHPAES